MAFGEEAKMYAELEAAEKHAVADRRNHIRVIDQLRRIAKALETGQREVNHSLIDILGEYRQTGQLISIKTEEGSGDQFVSLFRSTGAATGLGRAVHAYGRVEEVDGGLVHFRLYDGDDESSGGLRIIRIAVIREIAVSE